MCRVYDDQLRLHLKCGGCLISPENSDDVVLKVLDDHTNFGVNWTILNEGSRHSRYQWS